MLPITCEECKSDDAFYIVINRKTDEEFKMCMKCAIKYKKKHLLEKVDMIPFSS